MRWKNVDFEAGRIVICENRVYVPRTGIVTTTPKTGESCTVTVSPSVMALLKLWQVTQARQFSDRGVVPSGYVFTRDDGEAMHPDSPTAWLRGFAKRHGLPPIHPHLFRHTQASLLISEGVDILTVSKRLGHSKISTTLDIYSHALAKSDAAASAALDDLLYKRRA